MASNFPPFRTGLDPAQFLTKAEYDSDNNGSVDNAEKITDVAIADQVITRGQLLYLTTAPLVGGVARVGIANPTIASQRPAILMALESVDAGSQLRIIERGLVENLNTAAFTQGRTVYLGANGSLSATPDAAYGQPIGVIRNSNATNGSVYFIPTLIAG